jgi:hypothetical protein
MRRIKVDEDDVGGLTLDLFGKMCAAKELDRIDAGASQRL